MTSSQPYEPRGLQGPKSLTETSATSADAFSDFMVISNSNFSDLSSASPDWKAMEVEPVEEVIMGYRTTHEKLMDLTKKYKELGSEYQKKCETLQNKANEMKTKNDEVRHLTAKVRELSSPHLNAVNVVIPIEQLDADLDDESMDQSVKPSGFEFQEMRKIVEEHKTKCPQIRDQMVLLDDEKRDYEEECERLKNEMVSANNEKSAFEAECIKLRQELENKRKLFERVATQQTKLKEENQRVRGELDGLRKDYDTSLQDLKESRAEVSQTKEQMKKEKESLECQINELQENIKLKSEELDQHKRDFYRINDFSKEEIVNAIKKMKDAITRLKEQIKTRDRDNSRITDRNNQLVNEKDTLAQKNAQLTKELTEHGRNPSPEVEPEPPVVDQSENQVYVPASRLPVENVDSFSSPGPIHSGPPANRLIGESPMSVTQPPIPIQQPSQQPSLPIRNPDSMLSYAAGGGDFQEELKTCFFCPFSTRNGNQLEQHINDAHP